MQLRKAGRQFNSRAISIACLGLSILSVIPLRTAETRASGLDRLATRNTAQYRAEASCEFDSPLGTGGYEHFTIAYRYALHQIGGLSWRQAIGRDAQHHGAVPIDIRRATDCFRLVVSETPSVDAAWNDLAWLYLLNNDPVQAASCTERALSISNVDYIYYITLGVIQEGTGQNRDAGESYSHAILLYPRLVGSRFWQELRLRDNDLARRSFDAALAVARADYLRGHAPLAGEVLARLLQESNSPEAEALVQGVVAELPTVPGAWELLGEIRWAKADQAGAQIAFRRAIFISPDDPLPRELLARLSLSSNDIGTAGKESYRAWRLQSAARTPHSRRAVVAYRSDAVLRNDALPPDILTDLSPPFPFSSFFREISARSADLGRDEEAARFSRLADSATP
jgi:tetratricopeptide (TPR) repeat protein